MINSMNIMNIMFSMNFIISKHPLSMGLTLIIQTILTCLTISLSISSSWFSYIMFLVMIGGMLVLFIYMTSMASNEMFYMSINKSYLFIMLTILTLMSTMVIMNMTNLLFHNLELTSIMEFYYKTQDSTPMILKLYNYPTMNLTIFLMNYLLLTLIVVVKITKNFSSSLRQMK
uniref:NADH-ubiquinone oxidoreductase chain 6 n=1 Tax=Dilar sp. YW-2016 TaxID=1821762 RepID=A0A1S5QY63_9NEOP|nr:NADH dehydrogenase subunit 6 [Dilar sp. YW-2016]